MTHPVDIHVGRRIRQLRWLKGMTQQQLAKKIGVKFQQVQKYETGANRVSASRLWQLCEAFETPVGFFFSELPGEDGTRDSGFRESDPLCERDTLELVRAYHVLDSGLRRYLLDLMKALSRHASPPPASRKPKARTPARTARPAGKKTRR